MSNRTRRTAANGDLSTRQSAGTLLHNSVFPFSIVSTELFLAHSSVRLPIKMRQEEGQCHGADRENVSSFMRN
ncbi:hypothetical protein V2G26_012610 [Clonostachys chloroleuca]